MTHCPPLSNEENKVRKDFLFVSVLLQWLWAGVSHSHLLSCAHMPAWPPRQLLHTYTHRYLEDLDRKRTGTFESHEKYQKERHVQGYKAGCRKKTGLPMVHCLFYWFWDPTLLYDLVPVETLSLFAKWIALMSRIVHFGRADFRTQSWLYLRLYSQFKTK